MKLNLQHHLKDGQKRKFIENNNWYCSTGKNSFTKMGDKIDSKSWIL